ncbi:MAG: GntR family transcriptional regulator [Treponema sp.]|nr:GntR family transcriptional regulator [Treponema sp.]
MENIILDIKIDNDSKVKKYHQLYLFFVEAIKNNVLPENYKLPSIRILSSDYKISKNTVTKAYDELEKDGYIYSLSKSGYYVNNKDNIEPAKENFTTTSEDTKQQEKESVPTVDSILKETYDQKELQNKSSTFILDTPFPTEGMSFKSQLSNSKNKSTQVLMNSGDLINSEHVNKTIFSPAEALVESYTTAIFEHKNRLERNKNSDITGEAPLRIAIAAFLYKFHKINVNPAFIIVGSNRANLLYKLLLLDDFQKPVRKLSGLLQKAECSKEEDEIIRPIVACAEGFNSRVTDIFKLAGFEVIFLPKDEYGMKIEELEKSNATIAFIDSRDSQNGLNLSERNEKILSWANSRNYRFIFEYDTSTEIKKINSLYEKATKDNVIYLNCFSNLISKNINTTFIVSPKSICQSYKERYKSFGSPLSLLNQCALTDFLIKNKLSNYLENLSEL